MKQATLTQDITIEKRVIGHAAEAGVGTVDFRTYKTEESSSKYVLNFSKDDVDLFGLMKENELIWGSR
jgi:hypothetical protein